LLVVWERYPETVAKSRERVQIQAENADERLKSLLLPWWSDQIFSALNFTPKLRGGVWKNGEAATGGSCADAVAPRHDQQAHDDFRHNTVAVK
jgi:hypothetical protein